jgi:hypothetical protein
MGTDLSIKDSHGDNVFFFAKTASEFPDKSADVFKVLAEHGVKSANIPPGFQSPLYFSSILLSEERARVSMDESQRVDDVLEQSVWMVSFESNR